MMTSLLRELDVADENDTLARAIAWTVVCVDQEFPHLRQIVGLFADPILACEFANRWQAELRESLESPDEKGWQVDVMAVLPATGASVDLTWAGHNRMTDRDTVTVPGAGWWLFALAALWAIVGLEVARLVLR